MEKLKYNRLVSNEKEYYLKISKKKNERSVLDGKLGDLLGHPAKNHHFRSYNVYTRDKYKCNDPKRPDYTVIAIQEVYYTGHCALRGKTKERFLNNFVKFLNKKGYRTKAFDLEGMFEKI